MKQVGMATFILALLSIPAAVLAQTPPAGSRIAVDAADLPTPNATPSVSNSPKIVPRPEGALLQVPPGFTAELFADGLDHARWLATAPNGDIFLAEGNAGKITVLRDADGNGRAENRFTFAEDFERPTGMAFQQGALFVADTKAVWRLPYESGQTKARDRTQITPPGALGDDGGHWTRTLAFHPNGQSFYVGIGSRGNVGEEESPRATIQEFQLDGSGQKTFAAGLRNPTGIAFRPGSEDLFAVVNERDGLGDGLVPDFLTQVRRGGFYGWPYAYIGTHPQPGLAARRPDLVGRSIPPDLLFQSHSAPLGLVFYDHQAFGEEFRGHAFVALRGSWNSGEPRGYFVARVPFRDGKPVGHYEVFATGFRVGGDDRAEVWGRPVGLTVGIDGALYVADDTGNTVWKIRRQ